MLAYITLSCVNSCIHKENVTNGGSHKRALWFPLERRMNDVDDV
jgi:hypothetical protein